MPKSSLLDELGNERKGLANTAQHQRQLKIFTRFNESKKEL